MNQATYKQAAGAMAPDSANTEYFRNLQHKLRELSVANPKRQFDDLFNHVCDPRVLEEAYWQLQSNKGSRTAGIDGITAETIENTEGGVERFIEETIQLLKTGYKPAPVRRVMIPKRGKDELRPLGIPTMRDRLIQMSLKIVLEPIFEADFAETSYGYRPDKQAADAVNAIANTLKQNELAKIMEGDIHGFFNNIDHRIMMNGVKRRIKDPKILKLILGFLKAGVMVDGRYEATEVGTPQGGIISPLLANIYLTSLDEHYSDFGIGRYARYADDFVLIMNGTRQEAEEEKTQLGEFMRRELKLTLSGKKTLITRPEHGIVFLGFSIRRYEEKVEILIPPEKILDVEKRIKQIIDSADPRNTRETLESLIKGNERKRRPGINNLIRGWSTYFQHADNAQEVFTKLNGGVEDMTAIWLAMKHPELTYSQIEQRYKPSQKEQAWADGSVSLEKFMRRGPTPLATTCGNITQSGRR